MNSFQLKDEFDKNLYRLFNIVSDTLFAIKKKNKSFAKNEKFRNKHFGQRCFILATGPSLSKIDKKLIDKLSSEVIFGVNSLYKAKITSDLIPSYYSLLDNNYWGVSKDEFSKVLEKYSSRPPVIITSQNAVSILNNLNKNFDHIFIHAKHYPTDDIRFDLTKNLSITLNVVSASIQAAIFMGFKEIYLLGCDYTYFCSLSNLHCYDDKDELSSLPKYNLSFYLKYYHLTTEFHYLIAKLAKKNGIKIINLTEGSLLDAYPHQKLTDVLSNSIS